MKRLLILVLLVSATYLRAQTFEGIMVWKITSEITDPKIKAQMEEAEKQMNDPATKAQIKEMEEKLNDPEFKAMLDANPQLKAQIEAMKGAQTGGFSAAMPKSYTIKLKNKNVLTTMEGGMLGNMEFLYLGDKNLSYTLDRKAKTYSVMPPYKEDEKNKMDVKVTKTSETGKVMNHNCTKYIAESTLNGQKMEQVFWTTTDIEGIDFKNLKNQRMAGNSQSLFYDKIEGVPLKMEMKMPQGLMIMEVTEIKKQSLAAADFIVPADFKETKLPYQK
ncbi:MAG: DUF4412 domain-containing protein [Chryseolinea sp.]